ncbi:MAG TPA: hypothetical protein VEQ35_03320, partial [Beijerinckia sp.]|nr:hypothetical protein [Beijerinckia sp.]
NKAGDKQNEATTTNVSRTRAAETMLAIISTSSSRATRFGRAGSNLLGPAQGNTPEGFILPQS